MVMVLNLKSACPEPKRKKHILYGEYTLFLFRFQMDFSKFVSSEIRRRGAAEEREPFVSPWIAI